VIEDDRGGFNVPSIATIAKILRGKSRPDMDQDMAVLTEMVQTGLYMKELLRILYEEFVTSEQSIDRVEDRNNKLRRDLEHSQKALVEAMGEGSDFPRVELETKARTVIDALQGKRMREKERQASLSSYRQQLDVIDLLRRRLADCLRKRKKKSC